MSQEAYKGGKIVFLSSFNRRNDKSLSELCIGGRLQTSESTFELVIAVSWIGGARHHREALAVTADSGSARELEESPLCDLL